MVLTYNDFYLVTKNEILSVAGKWIELKNIILSEVIYVQRTKNYKCFFLCVEYTPNTNTDIL
jgi:hypothetical protein